MRAIHHSFILDVKEEDILQHDEETASNETTSPALLQQTSRRAGQRLADETRWKYTMAAGVSNYSFKQFWYSPNKLPRHNPETSRVLRSTRKGGVDSRSYLLAHQLAYSIAHAWP